MHSWDKELYYRFRAQRTQPSIDLVSRIRCQQPDHVVDLGCGPGNSTSVLRERWPSAAIVGVDNSDEMLRAARETDDHTQWVLADIAAWRPDRRYNVVFSNAAIQWLGDHQSLVPRLFEWVDDGGTLAVQLPDHYASALYQVLIDVSENPRWSARLENARSSLTRHSLSFYYDLLSTVSDRIDIWTTEYRHVLQTHEDILTFHRGTGMRPYLEALSTDEIDPFEQSVLEGYRKAFPVQANGRVLFPFQRLFFIAQR